MDLYMYCTFVQEICVIMMWLHTTENPDQCFVIKNAPFIIFEKGFDFSCKMFLLYY